jgi:hypothetical protein
MPIYNRSSSGRVYTSADGWWTKQPSNVKLVAAIAVGVVGLISIWGIGRLMTTRYASYSDSQGGVSFVTGNTDRFSSDVAEGLRPVYRSCTKAEMLNRWVRKSGCSAVLIQTDNFELIHWEVPESADTHTHLVTTPAVIVTLQAAKKYHVLAGTVVDKEFCEILTTDEISKPCGKEPMDSAIRLAEAAKMRFVNEAIIINGKEEMVVAKLPHLRLTNVENNPVPVTLPDPDQYTFRIAGTYPEECLHLEPAWQRKQHTQPARQHLLPDPFEQHQRTQLHCDNLWYEKMAIYKGQQTDIKEVAWFVFPGLESQYQKAAVLNSVIETLQREDTSLPEVPIPDQFWKDYSVIPTEEQRQTKARVLRLSNGEAPELLVEITDPGVCGSGGCPATLYGVRGGRYEILLGSDWRGSLREMKETTNGYKDLLLASRYVADIYKFDGTKYQPTDCFSREDSERPDYWNPPYKLQPRACQIENDTLLGANEQQKETGASPTSVASERQQTALPKQVPASSATYPADTYSPDLSGIFRDLRPSTVISRCGRPIEDKVETRSQPFRMIVRTLVYSTRRYGQVDAQFVTLSPTLAPTPTVDIPFLGLLIRTAGGSQSLGAKPDDRKLIIDILPCLVPDASDQSREQK